MTDDAMEVVEKPKISCDIRYLLYTAQQAHGLRHKDHARYHGFTTRKLRRLLKYTKIKFGSKRTVQPVSIAQILEKERDDDRHFLIAIFEVERCWAAAQEYKQQENARGNHHAIQRLRKGVKFAYELEQCCEGIVDARTTLEIKAYYAYIRGQLEFERQSWKSAESQLGQAKAIYSTLALTAVGTKSASYTSICDEIMPLINFAVRFSAFNTGAGELPSSGEIVDSKIKALIDNARGEENTRMDVVEWRIDPDADRALQVPIDQGLKQVKIAVGKLKDARETMDEVNQDDASAIQTKVDLCDEALNECREAIQTVRSDIHASSGKADASDVEQTSLLLNFLQYNRSIWLAERNLYLADDIAIRTPNAIEEKPGDFARLFDLVVKHFEELAASGIPPMVTISNIVHTAFKALRAYYLSLHEHHQNKNYRNALALNRKSLDYAMGASQSIAGKYLKVLPKSFVAELTKFLSRCINDLETTEFQLRAFITSSAQSSGTMENDDVLSKKVYGTPENPLVNDWANPDTLLGKIHGPETQIVEFPPRMKTTMVKPVLFDVADSYIEFPDFSDLMPKTEGKAAGDGRSIAQKASGWISWGWGK